MSKPELAREKVFGREKPSSQTAVQIARAAHEAKSVVSRVVPGLPGEREDRDELVSKTKEGAVRLHNTLEQRVGRNVLQQGALVETVGYDFNVSARVQAEDTEKLELTHATIHITSEAADKAMGEGGSKAHLEVETAKVPEERDFTEKGTEVKKVAVLDGTQSVYEFDDYNSGEQPDFADTMEHTATAFEQAKVIRVSTASGSKLIMH